MSNHKINTDWVLAFTQEFGRPPSLADLFAKREAEASVALDRDDEVGTYAVDGPGESDA